MEQQIRFCTSADGTRIAYATYGEPAARALVYVSSFDSAQELRWNGPGRALYEGLASGRRLVTFDRRGVGGSQRDVDDLARTSAGVAFEDRGEHELKGIAEPQRLFAVVGQD